MKKNVLITGTDRGLGKALVNIFRKSSLYNVYSLSRSRNKSNSESDLSHFTFDLNVPNELRKNFPNNISIDILINNAAVYIDDPRKQSIKSINNIQNITLDTIQETFNVNYFSPLELIKIFYEGFQKEEKKFGRIINISSGMGRLDEINTESYAYSSSKLLLNTTTIVYSKIFSELKEDIAIASICPGWLKTDMGTKNGLINPEIAAEYILESLQLTKSEFNGKFLRYGENLDWSTKKI